MKAIRIHAHGGPEVLQWEEVDLPAPGPGEIRIRHTAVGVNFSDVDIPSGWLLHQGAANADHSRQRGRRRRRERRPRRDWIFAHDAATGLDMDNEPHVDEGSGSGE